MKLKKIASLALAGVMAVSMLAGCSNDSNSNNGGNNGDNGAVVTPATTSVVNAVNKGQSAANDVKINFTVDSALDAALEKAVRVYGNDSDETGYNEVKAAITRVTGLKSVRADEGEKGYTTAGWVDDASGFLTENVLRSQAVAYDKDAKGKVYTWFEVVQLEDALNENAALNYIAWMMDQEIGGMAAHSNVDGNKAGTKYYGYNYDGCISMVSVADLDGTTDYYVAYVINQTVAEKTLA